MQYQQEILLQDKPILNNTEGIQFNRHYHQILSGVNRIRYIKTKQKRNQIKMTNHLNTIMRQIQSRKEGHHRSAPKLNCSSRIPPKQYQNSGKENSGYLSSSQKQRSNYSPYSFKSKQSCKLLVSLSSRQFKPPKGSILDKLNQKYNKENSGYYEHKPTDVTFQNSQLCQQSVHNGKQKLNIILKKKVQTYQQMKQIRLKLEKQQRLQHQASLHAARMRKQAVQTSCQQGCKKIQQNYFQHLQAIRLAKNEQKERKIRMTQKRFEELIELQKKQQEELDNFQKSLIMESNLKEIIELAGYHSSYKVLGRKNKNISD